MVLIIPESPEQEPCPVYVYFAQISGGGPIKIGASIKPMGRVLSLQAWCPFQIDLICEIEADYFTEAVLLDLQKDFRIRGEWFEPNAALSEIMAEAAEGYWPDYVADEIDRRLAALEKSEAEKEARKKSRPPRKHNPNATYKRTPASMQLYRERRAAADARRKAACGRGRKVEFKIVADPINAAE